MSTSSDSRLPALLCFSVPYPDGVSVFVRVEEHGENRLMTVRSNPDHPAGFFDRFIAHFTPKLLETIPLGEYGFTAILNWGTCKVLSCPDAPGPQEVEQRTLWLRHRIQRHMHDLARLVTSQREKASQSGGPRLTVLDGGKSSS